MAPHHTSTDVALVGGGTPDRPRIGLVTRAHAGVLFLDEAAEFGQTALDALRQSMETGRVALTRSGFHVELPARFQLVLATNPCALRPRPRHHRPSLHLHVRAAAALLARLEGPLLDRIDVRVTLRRPSLVELADRDTPVATSAQVADRVREARSRAAARLAGTPWRVNAAVPAHEVRRRWPVPADLQDALDEAARSRDSVRGLDLSLRVAWSLADLRGAPAPAPKDLTEALTLRNSEVWTT